MTLVGQQDLHFEMYSRLSYLILHSRGRSVYNIITFNILNHLTRQARCMFVANSRKNYGANIHDVLFASAWQSAAVFIADGGFIVANN